ncbi:MAG: ribonuclease H-like domain-containing protein [Thermoguttaceae bacterium]
MTRKYAAFDIETAADIPEAATSWVSYRPLGITCAAVFPQDDAEPTVYHGKSPDGTPAPRMTQAEARQLVRQLENVVAEGYTLLTWNGLGFDFDILAEESGALAECRKLARDHVDMMFHIFCERGFPVALDKAAEAMGIPGKPAGMSGLLAPRLWAQGRHDEVLDYVAQDVHLARDIALQCEKKGRFQWMTARGKRSVLPLPRGWLTVAEALQIPPPDTSWMSSPISRHRFTSWLGKL